MNRYKRSKFTLLMLSIAVLTACGGGGGGGSDSSDPPPPNVAPVANAGANISVDELTAVTLDGRRSSDANAGDRLTYSWTQTAGPTVTLTNATMAQATFNAPEVATTADRIRLTFQLTVSDGFLTATDSVDIVVNNVTPANLAPVANAGANMSVDELTAVTLDGSRSSDANAGDRLIYSWTQTAGPTVTLTNATMAQATFNAPEVATTAGMIRLTFQLTVSDGFLTATDSVDIVVNNVAVGDVRVSGIVSYEFVNTNANCRGLNFNDIETRPIRAATVQLLGSNGVILASTVANDDGEYLFAGVAANSDVRIRVRAELQRAGTPSWNVEVRDNVDTAATPRPLARRPVYVVQFPTFNTGEADITDANFTATTGWNGSAYTGMRAAAPFAILDAIYSGMKLVVSVDDDVTFPAFDVFWSVDNMATSSYNPALGELRSSHYSSRNTAIFLLGDADTNTEEFDDHLVVHEWGHYFEDKLSRADTIGGSHGFSDSLDPRLAFGEGWATALAVMALDDPQYCDTGAAGRRNGFGINVESRSYGARGYYNESSVAALIYDLYDTDDDGAGDDVDDNSIGFEPIYKVMTEPQASTEAFTTVFSFATALRTLVTGDELDFVDAQLRRENIDTGLLDKFGSGQTTQPTGARDVIPVYVDLPVDGSTTNICTNSDFDSRRIGNKLGERRFLRITTTITTRYRVVVRTTTPTPVTASPDDRDQSDPTIRIFRDGVRVGSGTSRVANLERFTTRNLPPDVYVAEVYDFRFQDAGFKPDNYPAQICFDITMTPQ